MTTRRLISALALLTVVFTGGCGGVSLPEEIGSDLDLDQLLSDLRDCDALSDTFVTVVREAAEEVDELSQSTDGSVPEAQLAERVDAIVETAYFEVAERLGCDAIGRRLDTVERLRELAPETAAGRELVDGVAEELETQSG